MLRSVDRIRSVVWGMNVFVLVGAPLVVGCASPKSDEGGGNDVGESGGTDGTGETGETGEESLPDPLSWDLGEAGPFNVGWVYLTLEYEVLGEVRTVPVSVWYPTLAETGDPVRYLDAFADTVSLGNAAPEAPVHADGYPVFLHSHGWQGFSGTSAFLMRHMASHGFVGIAPDHINNTLLDHVDPLPTSHYIHRPLDVRYALDLVIEKSQSGEILAGELDLSRVTMSGHSFGVHTSWLVAGGLYDPALVAASCAGEAPDVYPSGGCTPEEQAMLAGGELGDERVDAAVLLAGSISRSHFGETGHASVEIPLLSLSGTNDPVGADEQFATTTGLDLTWVELEGGCHQTFALGLCDTLEMEVGFEIVRRWTLGYVRNRLFGDESEAVMGLLNGDSAEADGTTIQHHGR